MSRYSAPACRRGGTTGVSNREEMDAGKPTFSGPTAPVVVQTGAIPVAHRRLPNTRERERESTHATPTQHTPLVYRKQRKRNAPDNNKDTNSHQRICINVQNLIQLRLRAGPREVRLQQQSAVKPPFGGALGLRAPSRGLAQETEHKQNPLRTYELLAGLKP